MKETKSFLQKNMLLFVALGVFVMFILFLFTNRDAPSLSLSDASAASESVYRFWSDPYQSHFYTVSKFERDFVRNNDKNWIYEGVVFDAFAKKQPNTDPVYRFWNSAQRSHFYTKSEVERDKVRQMSEWRYEGIAYYTLGKVAGSSPVYRLYSPSKNSHYYVQSESEKNALVAAGDWNLEGIAFYSKKVSATPNVPDTTTPPVDTPPSDPTPIPVSGSCGSTSGSSLDSAPTSGLCASGSATSVTGSGPWSWSCTGSNGGVTAQCNAQKTTVAVTQCSDGLDNDGDGTYDLSDVDCTDASDDTESGTTPLNGQCGTANTTTASEIPAGTSLCASGTVQNQVNSNGNFTWNCDGENGGDSSSCSMTLTTVTPINGQCSDINGTTLTQAPDESSLCASGTVSQLPTAANEYTWTCSGQDGGTDASCSVTVNIPVANNGQCGSANNTTVSEIPPSTSLCANGTVQNQSTTGDQFSWSCVGDNGGSSDSCQLTLETTTTPVAVNGQCGTSSGQTLDNAPTDNLCEAGNPSAISGSGPWSWNCQGENGGSDNACSAQKTAAPSPDCGIDHGQTLTAPPSNPLCQNGLISADETGSGPWLWTCRDTGGALVATCRAELEGAQADVQGQCGGSVNTCEVGDFIDAEDTDTEHIWGCIGSGDFSTFADCSMDK